VFVVCQDQAKGGLERVLTEKFMAKRVAATDDFLIK
jgi:hypothetical protein